MGRVVLLLGMAILLLVAGPLAASGWREGIAPDEQSRLVRELTPEDLRWNVAVGLVVGDSLRGADLPTVGSWVQILRDGIQDIPERELSSEYRSVRQRDIIQRRVVQVEGQLDTARREAERTRLQRGNPSEAQTRRVRELEEQLGILRDLDPRRIALPPAVPVAVSREDYRFRRTIGSAAAWAEDAEADILFYLRVDQDDNLYIITLHRYSPWSTPRDREIARVVTPPETALQQLEETIPALAREILSREIAGLRISVVDQEGMPVPSARVYLNSQALGFAPVNSAFLKPGTYRLEARSDDQRRGVTEIVLEPGADESVIVRLDPFSGAQVTITSDPPGAAVYQGTIFHGETPITIPVPREMTSITIQQEGYYESRITLDQSAAGAIVHRPLISRETNWEQQVEDARRSMYRSFGFFIVSLAVPIVASGMYDDISSLFPGGVVNPALSPAEQDRLLDQANTLFFTYYGGVTLSTGLFGNMLWRIVRYVRTAQGYHER
jgi:hypothetical protein